ncbi:MAG: cohesin domain-containing protein [bacterium]|nr:cohesin domain-containing protein [bacterium]
MTALRQWGIIGLAALLCAAPFVAVRADETTTTITVRLAQCADGVDNNGDGLIDYPADPDCTSALDDDESGTAPVVSACADSADNDGDLLIDYPADPGCESATDTDERNTVTLVVPGGGPPVTIYIPSLLQEPRVASLIRSCDLNADVRCDLGDLSALLVRIPQGGPVDARFDLSGDGILGLADIGLLLHYSVFTPPPVPPPPGLGELYLVAARSHVAPGDLVSIGVNLSAAVPVNAVDVELGYNPASLAFVGARTGQSLIDVWPRALEVLREGVVRIRGGFTTPFSGSAGPLAELTFRVVPGATNILQWSVRSGTFYRADGRGSPFAPAVAPLSIPLKQKKQAPIITPVPAPAVSPPRGGTSSPPRATVPEFHAPEDTIPPNIVALEVFRDPLGGEQLLLWSARDVESGVAGSEVRFREWLSWSEWVPTESPMQIPWGAWAVEVRVTDHAGNPREQTLTLWIVLIFKFATAGAFFALIRFTHRHRRRFSRA